METFKAQRLCGLCMRVTILMIKQPKKVDWNEATSYLFTKHDGVEFPTITKRQIQRVSAAFVPG